MASFQVTTIKSTGGTYALTVQRHSDGFYWQPATNTWAASPLFAQKQIAFAEGANENAGSYTAQIDSLSAQGNPGKVRIRIHNTGVVGNPTVEVLEGHVVSDVLVGTDIFPSTLATPANVSTQMTNVLNTTFEMDELTETPPARPTIRQALMLLYMALRNRSKSTADRFFLHNDANEIIMESTLVRSESEFTRDKVNNA